MIELTEESLLVQGTHRHGVSPRGRAKDIACPDCGADKEQNCTRDGSVVPPHLVRAKLARWATMFQL